MQIEKGLKEHYSADSLFLIEEQLGKKSSLDGHISLCAFLQIHVIVLYIIRGEKRSCSLLREDPQFWTYRLLSELMVRAADDDVRFLPYVFHKMMEKLSEESLWKLAVCGSLCCRCFCISDNEYADWPAIPSIPGQKSLSVDRRERQTRLVNINMYSLPSNLCDDSIGHGV
ncbi:uncharacterized protein [Solanum lycopersicum]|uniref:uncharacterized protein isoform X4 n=1 Tax=Solanum lycopersicum TaxID=4081 RepID=UPI000E1DF06E|nr:uncharacterized protein LOC101268424 isoform X1 [Solanum lycopersicum]